MIYDLNFWPEVDWKREGSMDPRFVLAAFLCLLLLAIGSLWSVHYSRVAALRADLELLKAENAKLEKTAAEVTRKKDCVAYWGKIIETVKDKSKARMPISRQLGALAAAMPDSVKLFSISIRSQGRDRNLGDLLPDKPELKKGGRTEPFLVYECVISGVASGADSEKTAAELPQKLASHPEIAPWVDVVQLTNIGPDMEASAADRAGRTRFTLVIQYNPLDWYKQ